MQGLLKKMSQEFYIDYEKAFDNMDEWVKGRGNVRVEFEDNRIILYSLNRNS